MVYGEYLTADTQADTDFELWGLGLVQEIDAAAMSMWLSYRNIEASAGVDSVDFQYVKAGALINF